MPTPSPAITIVACGSQCDVHDIAVSPSGNLLAYSVDGSGYETYNIRFRVSDLEFLPNAIEYVYLEEEREEIRKREEIRFTRTEIQYARDTLG